MLSLSNPWLILFFCWSATLHRSQVPHRRISNSTLSLRTVPFPCHPIYRHLPFLLQFCTAGISAKAKKLPINLGWRQPCHVFQTPEPACASCTGPCTELPSISFGAFLSGDTTFPGSKRDLAASAALPRHWGNVNGAAKSTRSDRHHADLSAKLPSDPGRQWETSWPWGVWGKREAQTKNLSLSFPCFSSCTFLLLWTHLPGLDPLYVPAPLS